MIQLQQLMVLNGEFDAHEQEMHLQLQKMHSWEHFQILIRCLVQSLYDKEKKIKKLKAHMDMHTCEGHNTQ